MIFKNYIFSYYYLALFQVKRDKIPCYFESMPGGCKKLHCSYFHQKIADLLKEEDISKKPDSK